MLLLRLLTVVLGALTTVSVLILGRFVVGIPVLTALGGRAGAPGPELPGAVVAATLVLAGAAGGGVTAWTAPVRPVLHALVLALAGGGLFAVVAAVGPPGGPGLGLAGLFFGAVALAGWLAGRLTER